MIKISVAARKKAKAQLKPQRERLDLSIKSDMDLMEVFWNNSYTLGELRDLIDNWIKYYTEDAVAHFDTEEDWSSSGGDRANFYLAFNSVESDEDYKIRMERLDKFEEDLAIQYQKAIDKEETNDLKEFNKLKSKLEKKGLI